MKKYSFNNMSDIQRKLDYGVAAVGSLVLLYGFTMSVPICNMVILLGGAIYYRYTLQDNYHIKKLTKDCLKRLIRSNTFYEVEEVKKIVNGKSEAYTRLSYQPELYYDIDDKFVTIKIRLDGSKHMEKYLELENSLQNLFIMECISKEQIDGYIIYKLDRNKTERLNIAYINVLDTDLIPINNRITWNFRKCPHALIAGVTGKGKTYFLAYLIKIFTLLRADIKILDPKMSDLSYLETIFHENVVSTPGQIAKVLRETIEEMNKRYTAFKAHPNYGFGKDFKDYGYKPLFIIFDEMAAFMAAVDKKVSKEIEDYLAEIIMKGRQAGVFMILTTQRPDADVIKTSIRDQLGLRIALGEMSKTGYTMVFGSDFNDLELNNPAPGNGFIYIDGIHTKPIKFQSPFFGPDYDFVNDLKLINGRG